MNYILIKMLLKSRKAHTHRRLVSMEHLKWVDSCSEFRQVMLEQRGELMSSHSVYSIVIGPVLQVRKLSYTEI